jgi:hypothetical protein
MITKETAIDIALAYREIETANKLLADIAEAIKRHEQPDIRDSFGRRQSGLQLGVPSGDNSHRLFDVPWSLAKPIIEAYLAQQKAKITALCEKARVELEEAA